MLKGGMQGMLKQLQKFQEEVEKTKNNLSNITVTEEVGGGMVKVTANGNQRVVSIDIDKQVINPDEKEILEDLIIAAVNKALENAFKIGEEELAKVSKGFIPPGMNIPGL